MNLETHNIIRKLEYELNALGVSDKTIKAYIFQNRKFLEIINKDLTKITSNDLKDYIIYLRNKKYKPATINLAISSIKFLYKGILRKNRFSKIKSVKKENKNPTILTKEEIISMIDNTSNIKHKLLIEFLYDTGVRVGELVNLKFNDMYLEEKIGIVRSGKGRKDRYIKLSDRLIKDLNYYKQYRTDSNPFIFNNSMNHITIRTAEAVIKQASKKAKIKKRVYPHALRASCATHLADNNTDITDIQKLLGHSKLETTQIYVYKSPKHIKRIKAPLDD